MEMLIALALFGLIGMAGLVLLTSMVNVRDRTGGRLERLTEIQDALVRIRSDLMQADGGSLVIGRSSLTLAQPGADPGRTAATITYSFAEGSLVRQLNGADAAPLLSGVQSVEFSPLPIIDGDAADDPPRAMDVILQLDDASPGLTGRIRLTIETASP